MTRFAKLKKHTTSVLNYVPEFFGAAIGGFVTASWLLLKTAVELLPPILANVGNFSVGLFRAGIATFGIFSFANYMLGGPADMPILVAASLTSGTFNDLPASIRYGLKLTFAGALANFEMKTKNPAFFAFGRALFATLHPVLELNFIIGRTILQGLKILQPTPNATEDNAPEEPIALRAQKMLDNAQDLLEKTANEIWIGVEAGASMGRAVKDNAHAMLSRFNNASRSTSTINSHVNSANNPQINSGRSLPEETRYSPLSEQENRNKSQTHENVALRS